ncbi:PilZ domain-containing protein [Allorhizobium pseudoryzae]|uniref:PilZ domain-containing protein n=1 Tax=Allorhizobium pseudoryzae TaxID=379684 RepID=UPI003CFDC90D
MRITMDEISSPAPRRRMLKGARIVFNNGHSTINVVVRDMSETGARVTIENAHSVPDALVLVLDDGARFDCEVARRTLTELGLRFVTGS